MLRILFIVILSDLLKIIDFFQAHLEYVHDKYVERLKCLKYNIFFISQTLHEVITPIGV